MTDEAMKVWRDAQREYVITRNHNPMAGEADKAAAAVIAAAMAADKADLREGVSFLLDRLDDFANDIQAEHEAREYHGHVAPAVARLRQALETPHADG